MKNICIFEDLHMLFDHEILCEVLPRKAQR
jgi:hypothetical protein